MIYSIYGEIKKNGDNYIVLETGGVGYKIFCPTTVLEEARKVKTKKLFCHQVVEKGELYGFSDEKNLDLFTILLGVSGVGPKIAIKLLSAFSPEELKSVILLERQDVLSKRGGVSKRSASKIIIDLNGKMKRDSELESVDVNTTDNFEIEDVLRSLGYSRSNIKYAIEHISQNREGPLQEKIKEALRVLAVRNIA